MLSASMMTWLTPIISDGLADGTSTRHSFCRFVQPAMSAKSLISWGTLLRPSTVARTIGGVAKSPVASKRRHRTGAEQQQHRNEVGEGRYGLHQVERRRDQPLVHPRAAVGPDADQQAGHHAEGDANDDQRQREHGIVPHAEDRQRQEAQSAQGRQPAAAGDVAQIGHGEHDAQPRQARQRPGRFATAELEALGQEVEGEPQRHVDDGRQGPGEPGEVHLQPGHRRRNPVLEGNRSSSLG